MKTVILEQADLIRSVADEICDILHEKPDAAFTIAGGRTMMPLWRELSVRTHGGKLSFAEAKFFQMAEFLNVPEEHTFRRQLEESFVSKTDLCPEACFWLDGTSPETCDDAIAAAGGLDFAVHPVGHPLPNPEAHGKDAPPVCLDVPGNTRTGKGGYHGHPDADFCPDYSGCSAR